MQIEACLEEGPFAADGLAKMIGTDASCIRDAITGGRRPRVISKVEESFL